MVYGGKLNGLGTDDSDGSDDWCCVSDISRDGEAGSTSSSADDSVADARLGVNQVCGASAWVGDETSLEESMSTRRLRTWRFLGRDLALLRGAEDATASDKVPGRRGSMDWSRVLLDLRASQASIRSSATLLSGSCLCQWELLGSRTWMGTHPIWRIDLSCVRVRLPVNQISSCFTVFPLLQDSAHAPDFLLVVVDRGGCINLSSLRRSSSGVGTGQGAFSRARHHARGEQVAEIPTA